ncbi:MAG: Pr6Pr family membrane protein [Atopobiaceae bacterium]|nr:Pr6Pr family membrane protein [Atopobiaceae bacterium]
MASLPVLSIVANVIIAVISLGAWLMLAFDRLADQRMLVSRGKESLRYFTVLSNLLSGMVSAIYASAPLWTGEVPSWLLTLKLMSTTAVMLTFLTVVLLLRPAHGFMGMFVGGNFWLHLVLPLLAAIDLCLFVPVWQLPWTCTLWAILPTLLYGIGYLRGVLLHGAEQNGVIYDFYGFLRWGRDRIPIVMAGMLLFAWVISLGLYFFNVALH